MTGLRWTADELDVKVKRGDVKIVGARLVQRGMDGDPEQKNATAANRAAKAKRLPQPIQKDENAATGLKTASKWHYEQDLADQLRAAGIDRFVMEHKWHPKRRFRADLAFVPERMLIEVQGEAHRIKGRFHSDIDKAQESVLQGWRLFPVSTRDVKNGKAVKLIKEALK
jgi:very-short-patch-repair endonuclease